MNFNILVDLIEYNSFERTGKPYIIFRSFYLQEIENRNSFGINTLEGGKYYFGKYTEDGNSDVIISSEFNQFDTLQQAYNHAEKLKLEFL